MELQNLFVRISADIKDFTDKMKKVTENVESFSENLNKVGRIMGATGALVSGSLTAMIYKYAQYGSAISDMADRTGVSTEVLARLGYVAETSGASIDTVELAIKMFQRRLTEAGESSEAMAERFRRIGVDFMSLKALKPEEQFVKLLEAISKIEDPTRRASAALEIFGRSGTMLLPMVSGGVEAFQNMMKQADELGVVIDKKAARAADALADSFVSMKKSALGLAITIGEALQPLLISATSKFIELNKKVREWTESHSTATRVISTGAIVVGTILTAISGLMLILAKVLSLLPQLTTAFGILKGALTAIVGPIGLVASAATTTYMIFKRVQKANEEAAQASERFDAAQARLTAKLKEAADAAGLTRAEFFQLTQKYDGNVAALARAIMKGKEGVALQQSLAEVGRKHAEAIDAQRAAQEKSDKTTEASLELDIKRAELLEKIGSLRNQLTGIIKRATLSEYEFQLWSLEQEYKARREFIDKEVQDAEQKNELLALMERARSLQVQEIEKKTHEERLAREHQYVAAMVAGSDEMVAAWRKAMAERESIEQAITNRLNQLRMSRMQYEIWSVQQEVAAEIDKINKTNSLTQAQKEFFIAQWNEYLALRLQQIKTEYDAFVQFTNDVAQILESTLTQALNASLDAFRQWGEQGGSVLSLLGSMFKGLANIATKALEDMAVAALKSAIKDIAAAKSKAIANMIASVMKLPFPLNLAVVGGAIAAVTALFSKIKLGEGGVVTRPTYALIGEKGPEAVVPLKQFPLGREIRLTVNLYGDINNVGGIDDISEYMGRRLKSMLREV